MARYIDADKLLKDVKNATPMNRTNSEAEIQAQLDWKCFTALTKGQPTADVEEVKHGEWQHRKWMDDFQHICSVCQSTSRVHPESVPYKHCPYCGAKMDGGKE